MFINKALYDITSFSLKKNKKILRSENIVKMLIETITNDKGEVLKTEQGHELKKFMFEVGDKFIPQWNSISVKDVEVVKKGEKEIIQNYKLLCHVMDKNSNIIYDESQEDPKNIFVTLTGAQANSLMNKIKGIRKDENGVIEEVEPINITQHKFVAYSYFSKARNKSYIGVGFEPSSPEALTFEDFEKKEVEESEQNTSE